MSKSKPVTRNGRLTAIKRFQKGPRGNRQSMILVQCDCGTKKQIRSGDFKATLSCGCLYKWSSERAIKRLEHCIQREINQLNKYQHDETALAKIGIWLQERGKELSTITRVELNLIEACSTGRSLLQ
jgi:hypothetical protein